MINSSGENSIVVAHQARGGGERAGLSLLLAILSVVGVKAMGYNAFLKCDATLGNVFLPHARVSTQSAL